MTFAFPAQPLSVQRGAAGAVVPALAAAASDPGSSRLVYAAVGGLALIGVAAVVLAVWLIRQTRVDPVVLAPLERMGDGDWRRKDPATQRRLLDEERPEGAEPLHPEPAPPGVDDEFERADRSVRSLDDLAPLHPEGADHTPAEQTPIPAHVDGDDSGEVVADAVAVEDEAVVEVEGGEVVAGEVEDGNAVEAENGIAVEDGEAGEDAIADDPDDGTQDDPATDAAEGGSAAHPAAGDRNGGERPDVADAAARATDAEHR